MTAIAITLRETLTQRLELAEHELRAAQRERAQSPDTRVRYQIAREEHREASRAASVLLQRS